MYEAQHWHTDSRLQAPMVVFSDQHIFVGQFIILATSELCQTVGKVIRFVQKVSYCDMVIHVYIYIYS